MYQLPYIPEKWKWFYESRYGLFLHWGPYAALGRGEQVLFRDHMDPIAYEEAACKWNPQAFDANAWAADAVRFGMKYACLTTRHHDGYCLWDSKLTDYTSMQQAPKRDFVREYVDAFRAAGLKVGLYYSWLDWRVPAYFDGPQKNPEGWAEMKAYIWGQLEELLTGYGQIDYLFFDGAWPRSREELGSVELLEQIRIWQPGIMVNNRLGAAGYRVGDEDPGADRDLGDFGTPEREIWAERSRMWESCDVTTQRLWGYGAAETVKSPEKLLDILCECAEKGGNLLMNIGPDGDGRFPEDVRQNLALVGDWLRRNGEAVYGTDNGDFTEFLTNGRETSRGNTLYLILKYWYGEPELRVNDLMTDVTSATLLTDGTPLSIRREGHAVILSGLPKEKPEALFPVVKLECNGPIRTNAWGHYRNWQGDADRIARWAEQRGKTVWVRR